MSFGRTLVRGSGALFEVLPAPDAQYNNMETEFLIYNFRRNWKYQEDALQRMSLLNQEKLDCVIHFLKWCAEHPHWHKIVTKPDTYKIDVSIL